jgi:hypothetical protein
VLELIGRLISFGIFGIWPAILLGISHGFAVGLAFFSVMAALFSLYQLLIEIRDELRRAALERKLV